MQNARDMVVQRKGKVALGRMRSAKQFKVLRLVLQRSHDAGRIIQISPLYSLSSLESCHHHKDCPNWLLTVSRKRLHDAQ